MKHDLKGYHKYQQNQPENAAPHPGGAMESAQENAPDPHGDQPGVPGQEPGTDTPADDLNREADGSDIDLTLDQICKRCLELEDNHLRTLAAMDNFKKRLTREREEQTRFAAEAVLADILPALDNFDLALSYARGNEAYIELITGLDLAQKSLLEILSRHGLTSVGEAGEAFDPEIHEALTQEPNSNVPAGHVSQLFQKGYLLKGRLLRPAKVIVSAG
jgi:molecular chaperone GrpE